jgi:hypothetical protein
MGTDHSIRAGPEFVAHDWELRGRGPTEVGTAVLHAGYPCDNFYNCPLEKEGISVRVDARATTFALLA